MISGVAAMYKQQEPPLMTAEAHTLDPSTMTRRMEAARTDTLRLFAMVANESDLRRPPAPGFRPILWHLGHIGAYEAYWILGKSKRVESPSARYEAIFDPIRTPREDA